MFDLLLELLSIESKPIQYLLCGLDIKWVKKQSKKRKKILRFCTGFWCLLLLNITLDYSIHGGHWVSLTHLCSHRLQSGWWCWDAGLTCTGPPAHRRSLGGRSLRQTLQAQAKQRHTSLASRQCVNVATLPFSILMAALILLPSFLIMALMTW